LDILDTMGFELAAKPQAFLGRVQAYARAALLRRLIHVPPREDLVLIGHLIYGGYRVPLGGLRADSVVYSVGVGEDINFDLGLIARFGCTVHAMDPVPRSVEFAHKAAAHEPRFLFHPLALWSRDETLTFAAPREEGYISHSAVNLFNTEPAFQAPGRSLRSLMDEWGHDTIDLLKISAEGAEFEILDTLLRDGPTVPILCAEFSYAPVARAQRMLGRLADAGYALVSAHVGTGGWTFTWLHTRPQPGSAQLDARGTPGIRLRRRVLAR
jgi:FkbM family methyltransferase